MEGAQTHQVGATAFELDMATDHLGDVDARKQFLQEARRDHAPSLATPLASGPAAGVRANMPL